MNFSKAAKIFVGFSSILILALGGILPAAAYQIAVFPPQPAQSSSSMPMLPYAQVPPGYTVLPIGNLDTSNDQIVQLNNLTVESVSGPDKPGMIYASDNSVIYCMQFRSTEGYGFRAPCPQLGENVLYQISVANDTIMLFRNRRRAALSDFEPGDRINVFGFLDTGSGLVQALIVRDLSKSGSVVYPPNGYYTQMNNLRVVSAPSSPNLPATLTATAQNPCGYRVPCTLMSMLYTINVNQNTQVLDLDRQLLPLSAINPGDIVNVYGWYANGTFNALILRDLSANGAITNPPTNPQPVISGVSGPTTLNVGEQGTWTVNASDPANGTLSYSVNWGDSSGAGLANPGSASIYQPVQQAATFTHTYQNTGTYTPRFTVANSVGQSATVSLTVVVSGNTAVMGGPVMITSLTPTYGPAGTQVTILGSGFSSSGNIVHFVMNNYSAYLPGITSADGNTITFSVPSSSSIACEYATPRCLPPDYALPPGTYSVSVENPGGVSNPLGFTLTPGPVFLPAQH